MANIPSAAQIRSNPAKYALRDYSPGVGGALLGLGRMSVTLDGKRVALTPKAARAAARTARRDLEAMR